MKIEKRIVAGLNSLSSVCRLVPLVLLLASGCMSFHKGYVVYGPLSSVRRDEKVYSIKNVSLMPEVTARRMRVTVDCATESALLETTIKTTTRKEKRMAVGVMPALLSEEDRVVRCSVAPLGIVFANCILLGMPTLASLCFEPFTSDYGENVSADVLRPPGLGLAGVYKYWKVAPSVITNTVRAIQQGIPRRIPLVGVKVKCDIPEVSFSDFGVTDDHGNAEFTLAGLLKRRADVVLTIQDVTRNPYANLLAQYVGKPETYRVAFAAGDAAITASVRSHALKLATWRPEPVALAPLTAIGTSVSSAQTLSEWFYNSLAETRYFALMARSDMELILKEQKFQRSETCDDTGCLVEMGRILAVRRVIGGSIGVVGEQAVFTARMVDVETGEIVATAKTSAAKDSSSILKMIEDGSEALCSDYADTMK